MKSTVHPSVLLCIRVLLNHIDRALVQEWLNEEEKT